MSYCDTVCTVPSGYGYGLAGVGSCGLVPFGGALSGFGYGGVACSTQLPGSEVVIQPSPSVVSLPGPVLSASGDPVAVSQVVSPGYPALGSAGGFSGGLVSGGYGRLGYGGGYGIGYGSGYGSGYCGGYGNWRRYSRRCLPYYSCGPC